MPGHLSKGVQDVLAGQPPTRAARPPERRGLADHTTEPVRRCQGGACGGKPTETLTDEDGLRRLRRDVPVRIDEGDQFLEQERHEGLGIGEVAHTIGAEWAAPRIDRQGLRPSGVRVRRRRGCRTSRRRRVSARFRRRTRRRGDTALHPRRGPAVCRRTARTTRRPRGPALMRHLPAGHVLTSCVPRLGQGIGQLEDRRDARVAVGARRGESLRVRHICDPQRENLQPPLIVEGTPTQGLVPHGAELGRRTQVRVQEERSAPFTSGAGVEQIGVDLAVIVCMVGERDEPDQDVPSRAVRLRLRPGERDVPK